MHKLNVAIKTISITLPLLFLTSCHKKPKKLVFDPRTHIDCLPEDEYYSDNERIHARDIMNMHNEQNQRIAQVGLHKSSANILSCDERIQLFEAKLTDIPIPLGAKPIHQYFDAPEIEAAEIVLGYSTEQSIDELSNFYQTSMIQFDWRLVSAFSGLEHMFVFEKLDQMCVVSLRPQEGWFYRGGYTQIILFLAPK